MIDVQLGNIGTVFRLTVYRLNGAVESNLGSASTIRIKLRDPSGTSATKTATLTNDGSDGKMQYTTVAGDLATAGTWQIQGYFVLSGGTYHTSVVHFNVAANL